MSVDVAASFFYGVCYTAHNNSSPLVMVGELLMSLSVLRVVSESTPANQIQILLYEPS